MLPEDIHSCEQEAYLGGGLGLGLDAGADLGGEHSLLFVGCVCRESGGVLRW